MSGTRKRVLLDVDGVLADFLTPALEALNTLLPPDEQAQKGDIKTWDIFDHIDKKYRTAAYDLWGQEGFCLGLKPIEGAQRWVDLLKEENLDVYYVTSPMHSKTWCWERMKWLQKHFQADPAHIMQGSAKYLCKGNFLVDDHVGNVIKWQEHQQDGYGIVFGTSTNQNDYRHPLRGDSYSEVSSIIDRLREHTF